MKNLSKVIALIFFVSICSIAMGQKSNKLSTIFGNGKTVITKDSLFKAKFNFRVQNLLVADYAEQDLEFSSKFLIRRMRFKMGGFVLSPKLAYKVELGLSNRDVGVNKEKGQDWDAAKTILDLVLKYKFADNWELWLGHTKLPGNRERVISSGSLQFVDRSIVNSRYNIDRVMGIQLRGKINVGKGIIAPSFAFSKGEGKDLTSPNLGGYDYTMRVEYLPFGKFSGKGDYFASDLAREPKPKLSVGAVFDYNDRAVKDRGQLGNFIVDNDGNYMENSLKTFFADAIFKYSGWSFESTYAVKGASNFDMAKSFGYYTGSGFSVQSGYLFKNNFEIAGRFSTIERDDSNSKIKDEHQYTLGLSKYLVGHNLKIQTDFTRKKYPNTEHGKYQGRLQIEMQF